MKRTDAVFLIGFGGPEKREDVRPFLEHVTRGSGIPSERIDEVSRHYEAIGGASPINAITNRQAEGLRKCLGDIPVYVGNRNWQPLLEDALRKMAADGIHHAVGFPTAAHRCEASWGRYLSAVESARQKIGPAAPEITYVRPWFDHPLFIEAICERITSVIPRGLWRGIHGSPTESLGDDGLSWLFTAHSIPAPMAEASRYRQELEATAGLVCARFGMTKWSLAYTSRSGAPSDPWLGPDICDEIRAQAGKGVHDVLVIPIGFLTDHVEVLYDLDMEAKKAAREAGVSLRRAPTVGDHPLFIQMIADIISKTSNRVPVCSSSL